MKLKLIILLLLIVGSSYAQEGFYWTPQATPATNVYGYAYKDSINTFSMLQIMDSLRVTASLNITGTGQLRLVTGYDTIANVSAEATANGQVVKVYVEDFDLGAGARVLVTFNNTFIAGVNTIITGVSFESNANFVGLGAGGFFYIIDSISAGKVVIAFYNMTGTNITNLTPNITYKADN